MTAVSGDGLVNTADVSSASQAERGREYLLCIDGERSFTITIPPTGELVIGRGPEATITVADPLISRAHAQLLVVPDGLRIRDLDSRHGTLVNGERITEPRLLGSGDVITIGNTLLVVRRQLHPSRARVIERAPLMRRVVEELARVVRYERELAVLVVRPLETFDGPALLADIAGRLRVIDTVAVVGAHAYAVLAPELDAEDALRLGRAIAATRVGAVAIGLATAPFDGIDGDALLGAARAAADAAGAGQVMRARDATCTITAGEQRIAVADPQMARLYELAERLARSAIPVLIHGETGVGKELAAAAVHAFSPRAAGPFVSVNCAAIPETLAESELFGYARGAFSGALAAKPGQIEAASGGTLFLDEIGELSPAVQAKLLRVLEAGELVRVGEVKPRAIDLRIVAATNRDLAVEVEAGRFRRDLFYRLGAARLELPPLRDRPRDLALLAGRLLTDACGRLGRDPLQLSIAAAIALFRHDWPGNIRELRHAIDYAAAAAPDSATEVEIWHLPRELASYARTMRDTEDSPDAAAAPLAADEGPARRAAFRPIADEVRELERTRMIEALRETGGVQNRAAELIEMPLRTFVTKLRRYGIAPGRYESR